MSNKNKLKYNSSPCGSGKTSEVFNVIKENIEQKFLLIQGTKALIDESKRTLLTVHGIVATAIYSTGDKGDNVMDRITKFHQEPTSRVLIITDKTFWNLSISLLSSYKIYIDDVVSFSVFKTINEKETHIRAFVRRRVFNELKDVASSIDSKGNATYVTTTKKEQEGDLYKSLQKEFRITEQNDKFFMNKSWFKYSAVEQLSIFAYKDLTKYMGLDITFMANDFENSLIYLAYQDLFERVDWNLRTRTIPLKDRLAVKYFSKGDLSATWKENNPQKLKTVYDYLNTELNGSKFLWTKNKKDGDQYTLLGKYISPDSRGLNDYQDYKTCVWLASMKPAPTEQACLEHAFDITGAQIVQARELETLHQFVMRGVIRDYDSTEIQTVYVFSEEQAKSLVSDPQYIDLGLDDDEPKKLGAPVKTVTIPPHITKRKCVFINKCKDEGIEVTHPMFKEWVAKKCEDTSIEVQESMIANFMKKHGNPG
ncbi:hypothetical protein SJS82_00440 [Aeromonas media]|uniref:Type III restriction endonuclease subunit R n=1 Tax=Aeromonas media TaxID=651 RepID=A0AAP6G7X8_AERME|nr:hypothetical protein [Aeromonas media]MDX7920417.1 hypothetical protein [Aeromonas media]